MPEKQFAVEMVGVDYRCDDCGALMERDGAIILATNPPKFPHRCKNGHTINLLEAYPLVRHTRIEPNFP